MPEEAEYKRIVPMSQVELLALDNICPSADSGAFGKATPSSRSFWLDTTGGEECSVELTRSMVCEGAYELAVARGRFPAPVIVAATDWRRKHQLACLVELRKERVGAWFRAEYKGVHVPPP